jgi:Icc-related predicted phosphoesterase
MKIAYCSDLHLEFGKISLTDIETDTDVLVIAGDIALARHMDFNKTKYEMKRNGGITAVFYDFFKEVSDRFKHVIYVVGNHEHYSYDFKDTITTIKGSLSQFPNIHLLDKECMRIGDTTFIGGTMWTDMNGGDTNTMWHVGHCMNDFRNISNSNRMVTHKVPLYARDGNGNILKDKNGYYIQDGHKFKEDPSTFCVEDAMEDNKRFLDYLKIVLKDLDKVVVVTHHTPSHKSIHPAYGYDTLMNGGYHNDLDQLILDNPNIKLWIHGHTHNSFDYNIGSTRVVCNPRGYHKYEKIADTFKLKFVEV